MLKLIKLSLIVFILLNSTICKSAQALEIHSEEATQYPLSNHYRYVINLSLQPDEADLTKLVPHVTIHKTDYRSGLEYEEELAFPDQAISKSAEAIDYSDLYYSSRSSGTYTLYRTGHSLSSGTKLYKNKAYQLFNVQNYRANFKGMTSIEEISGSDKGQPITSIIYEYDVNTKTLKTMKKWLSSTKSIFNIYPQYQYYSVKTSRTSNDQIYKIYDIKTDKLIQTSSSYIDEYSDNEYNHRWFSPNAVNGSLILNYDSTYRENNNNTLELTANGKVRKLSDPSLTRTPNSNFGHGRKMKIGKLTYEKKWFEGQGWLTTITRQGKTTILTKKNTASEDYFSPNQRYLLIVERHFDATTNKPISRTQLKIYDLKNNKWAIQMEALAGTESDTYPHVTWIGDEFVTLAALHGCYLHIPTGTVSKYGDTDWRIATGFNDTGKYMFDINQYISPVEPRIVKYNGTYITYSGQGTFNTNENEPYVPVGDFVKSFSGSYDAKQQLMVWSNQQIKLDSKSMMMIQGRLYYSLEKLAEQSNMKIKSIDPYSWYIYGYEIVPK